MKSPDSLETLQIGMTASRTHMSGTDRYFQDLLRALPRLGIGVRGMVIGEPQAVDDAVPGIESFASEGESRLKRIRGARRVFKRLLDGSDLIVSHGPPHTFYVLDQLRARPLVAHFHGPWALEGREEGSGKVTQFVRRMQEAAVYGRARRFIVLSRAFADTLEHEFGVDPGLVRVVPGGVDLERFQTGATRAEARARFGWPLERPIVIATRRLRPTKGIGALIEAIAIARRHVPGILCFITGTGELAPVLQAQARELQVEENVRFLGHVASSDLPLMYRAADLSIVPSNAWEGFGLSVIESLACGTPALVTPVGGLPEVVRDLSQSLILRDHSVDSIVAGLSAAFNGTGCLPSVDACKRHAERFGWASIVGQIADVYREVV